MITCEEVKLLQSKKKWVTLVLLPFLAIMRMYVRFDTTLLESSRHEKTFAVCVLVLAWHYVKFKYVAMSLFIDGNSFAISGFLVATFSNFISGLRWISGLHLMLGFYKKTMIEARRWMKLWIQTRPSKVFTHKRKIFKEKIKTQLRLHWVQTC